MKYAVRLDESNIVVDVTNIDTVPDGWMDATSLPNAVMGATWDGSKFTPPPNPTVISAVAFLDRFTPAEQVAVQTAAVTNPAEIGTLLTVGMISGMIDLTDPKLITWIGALVTANAITSARSTEILTP